MISLILLKKQHIGWHVQKHDEIKVSLYYIKESQTYLCVIYTCTHFTFVSIFINFEVDKFLDLYYFQNRQSN